MDKLHFKSHLTNESSLNKVGRNAFTPSNLLIPKHYREFFQLRRKQFNGISNYFTYLMICFVKNLPELGLLPRDTTRKWKKEYQKPGRMLKKVCFVADPCTWEYYRQISNQYGISICHLLVIVMRLDWYDWLMADCPNETPGLPKQYDFRKYLPKWQKKLKIFNSFIYSYQKLDLKNKILLRTGHFNE